MNALHQQAEAQQRLREAQQAAEADRIKREAARSAQELQRAAANTQIMAGHRELRLGQSLFDKGDHWGAIKAFNAFLAGQPDKTTPPAYAAQWGLANSLNAAGLKFVAAGVLVDTILQGAEKPNFQQAFDLLRALRAEINYSPPILESFTKFFVGNLSQAFQDRFHYFLGEFFYDFNNFSKARKFLDLVSEGDPIVAKAKYLKGLILVKEKKYRSAVKMFEQAVLSAESLGADQDTTDLAYLAIARIAYEVHNYSGAVYYYRKVPRSSVRVGQALFEAGWSYFMQGNYRNAMGVFHALHSPYLDYRYYPELYILEATAYLNLCRFANARDAVDAFNDKFASQSVPLKKFLASHTTPQALYDGLTRAANGDTAVELPSTFIEGVLGDVDFYNLYRTVRDLERELDRLNIEGQSLGPYATELKARVQAQHKRTITELGIKIQQILKGADTELTHLTIKATEVTFEIDNAEKIELERQISEAYSGKIASDGGAATTAAASLLVGDRVQLWDFDGEYWEDELTYMKAFVRKECVDE